MITLHWCFLVAMVLAPWCLVLLLGSAMAWGAGDRTESRDRFRDFLRITAVVALMILLGVWLS